MNINISGEVVRTSQLPKRIIGLGDYLVALNSSPLETSTVLVSDFVSFLNTQFATSLASLTDVSINGPLVGQALVYDGSRWVNQGIGELDTLNSVTTRGNTTTNNITVGTLYFGNASHYLVTDNASYAMLSSNRTLQLATSGNPVLSVFTSQNVGIGTTTDSGFKLDVNGNTRVGGSMTVNNRYLYHQGTSAIQYFMTSNAWSGTNSIFFGDDSSSTIGSITYNHQFDSLSFGVNGSTAIFINSSRNIGIGTGTPTNAVHIRTAAGGATSNYALVWQESTGDRILGYLGADNSAFFSGALYLYQNGVSNTKITANGTSYLMGGNVLIGTTTDSGYKLDVNGTARIQGNTEISRSGADTQLTVARGGGAGFTIQGKANSTSSSEGVNLYWTADTWLKFVQGTSVVANFSNSGNFLLGTNVDASIYKLDVNGYTRLQGALIVQSPTGGDAVVTTFVGMNAASSPFLELRNPAAVNARIGGLNGGGLLFQTGTTERARIVNNGNFLIGTTTDAGYKLDVNGSTRVGDTSSYGDVFVVKTPGSGWSFDYQYLKIGSVLKLGVDRLQLRVNNDTAYVSNDGDSGNSSLTLMGGYNGAGTEFAPVIFGSGRQASLVRETMRVDNQNQRVGIGTTTPTAKLHISGASNNGLLVSGLSSVDFVLQAGNLSGGSGTVQLYAGNNNNSFFRLNNEYIREGGNGGLGINISREDITAKLHVKGIGATSATTAFTVQNSISTTTFSVRDDGGVLIPGYTVLQGFTSIGAVQFYPVLDGGYTTSSTGRALRVDTTFNNTVSSTYAYQFGAFSLETGTASTINGTSVFITLAPTSGTKTFTALNVGATINATGTYSGIVRGIFYNSVLTSMTGVTHRAIETTSGDVIFNGGNVGIGTSSPSSALEISQTTPIVRLDSSAVGSFYGIEFTNTGNIDAEIKQLPSSGEFRISNGRFAGWNGFITLYTDTVERMRIRSNGNVLIGATADAGYKLDVNGTGRFSGNLEVNAGANGQIFINNLYPRLLFGKTGTPSWSMYVDTENSGQFEIGTGAGFPYNTFTSRLYISSGGNVGIGTNLPGYKLDVVGDVRFQKSNGANLYLSETGGNAGDVAGLYLSGNNFTWGGSIRYNVGAGGANNRLDFYTGASRRMSLAADTGNTLINTITDAGYKLDVNGTARVNDIFYVTNSAYTGSLRIQSIANQSQRIMGGPASENITWGPSNSISINAGEVYVSSSFLGPYFWIQSNGAFCLGQQAAADSSSILDIRTTTKGFLKPRLTTTQKNAITTPATGLEVYDSTTNTPNYYNGTTWIGVASNQSTGLSPGLFAQTSDSTPVANTTVETTLISTGVGTLSVPANQFQVGASYIAYLSGVISSQNNATMEIHLRSNGFVLADTNPMTLSATTGKFWELHVNFTIRAIGGGGVAAIVTSGRFSYNKDSGNTPESVGFSSINNTTFDTTINNTLTITATWGSASPLDSIYTRIFNLYRVY